MAEQEHELIRNLRRVSRDEGRYPFQAYAFLWQALEKAHNLLGERRHVTGPELLEGVREAALDMFGPLTLMVFGAWNVTETDDFGRMVFHLVEHGLMGKTEEDRLEDFSAVYDLHEAFDPKGILADTTVSLCDGAERFVLTGIPLGARESVDAS
ncbi:MAG: hypothetical protein JKY65_07060 [Planctomycetes bacterium]|nr:hypothetical protein [Planctomycetota bacterium]